MTQTTWQIRLDAVREVLQAMRHEAKRLAERRDKFKATEVADILMAWTDNIQAAIDLK